MLTKYDNQNRQNISLDKHIWQSVAVFILMFSVITTSMSAWSPEVYNPNPMNDDVLLPLPCDGAMAFRWVEANGTRLSPATGQFSRHNKKYMLAGKYEVNSLQYKTITKATDGLPCPKVNDGGRLAKGGLNWFDATDVAVRWSKWLEQHAAQFPDCTDITAPCIPKTVGAKLTLRLPNATEWEYLARGGLVVTPRKFRRPLYSMPDGLDRHAWYTRNSQGIKPIGGRDASPLGLHDIYGNVEELTLNPYQNTVFPGQIGEAAIRGGSIYTNAGDLNANRYKEINYYSQDEANRVPDNGLRLIADIVSLAPSTIVTQTALSPPLPPKQQIGYLQVNVDAKAQLRIDGRPVGQATLDTPFTALNLSAGTHTVELSINGSPTISKNYDIIANRWAVIVEPPYKVALNNPPPVASTVQLAHQPPIDTLKSATDTTLDTSAVSVTEAISEWSVKTFGDTIVSVVIARIVGGAVMGAFYAAMVCLSVILIGFYNSIAEVVASPIIGGIWGGTFGLIIGLIFGAAYGWIGGIIGGLFTLFIIREIHEKNRHQFEENRQTAELIATLRALQAYQRSL